MGNPPFLSLRFALVLSVSFAASYTTTSAPFFPRPKSKPKPKPKPHPHPLSQSTSSLPKATAKDLLTLLGPPQQALSVNQQEAKELMSCFKFLVPFDPANQITVSNPSRRSLGSIKLTTNSSNKAEDNELIWWPPAPVMELARLAVDSGGDPGVVHRALDPTVIQVPDVEGSKERRCELTRTSYGRRFINEEYRTYAVNEFPEEFHKKQLFHAKEYPSYDKDVFPYNMGFCQTGSNVTYDDSMNLRNILWLAPLPSNSTKTWLAPGVLVVLDARPDGIIYKDLIPEYVNFARTIYEDDFGEVVLDVNYLNVGTELPIYEVFL